METPQTYCKNCGELTKDKYCSLCGQRTTVHRVTFRETFRDLSSALFSLEGPLWKTLSLLIRNPGRVLREFLEGHRKKYYKPVTFFILTTAVYLLVRSLINFDPYTDSTIQVQGEDFQDLTNARNYMLLNINKLLFIFVFTMALWLKLFFYRKYSLAEFIVVSFYLCGMYTIIVTLNMFYLQFVGNVQFIAVLMMWIYFVYAIVSFFQKKVFLNIIKAILAYALAFLTYVFLAFGLSYLIIKLS